jgi:hypothetical protein
MLVEGLVALTQGPGRITVAVVVVAILLLMDLGAQVKQILEEEALPPEERPGLILVVPVAQVLSSFVTHKI